MYLKSLLFIFFSCLSLCSILGQEQKSITANGMKVTWYHSDDRIYFTLKAPTTGWLAIGFNTSNNLTDTYLIMCNVIKNKTRVVEHYVIKPGAYHPIDKLGGTPQVLDINGSESNEMSAIHFSLPQQPACSHQKPLDQNRPYHLLIAYSLEDDFNHHSIMRTTTKIIL